MTVPLAPVSILNLTLWFLIVKSAYHGFVPALTVPRDKGVSLQTPLVSTTCTALANLHTLLYCPFFACVACHLFGWALLFSVT